MSDLLNDSNFKGLSSYADSSKHEEMNLELFVSLMKQFYSLGWMKGSGGAMGCLVDDLLYVSPSALQKERLKKEDIFIYNVTNKSLVQSAENPKITVSSCAVIFTLLMNGTGCACVIHTHSIAANLITQLTDGNVFEISDQEYLKGIWDPFTGKMLTNTDTLSIPIIDNMPSESQLKPGIEKMLDESPRTCAVLVRNHGLFVWGPSWEETKIMTECIEYLLELSVEMKKTRSQC